MGKAGESTSPEPLFPEGVAVVVGDSGGIGSEICAKLAEAGSDVALTYGANAEGARAVTDRILRIGHSARNNFV